MEILKPYLRDLEQLAHVGAPLTDAILGDPERFFSELGPSLKVLDDGILDPGDLETVSNAFWEKFKAEEIAATKHTVRLQRRLMPLYEYMDNAPEEVWEALAKIMNDARFRAQKPMFQFLAASSSALDDELDELDLADGASLHQ